MRDYRLIRIFDRQIQKSQTATVRLNSKYKHKVLQIGWSLHIILLFLVHLDMYTIEHLIYDNFNARTLLQYLQQAILFFT